VAQLIARTLLCSFAVAACGLTGCAGTYDLLTSQRFKERPFHTLFTTEDPIVVLETVQEGDDRVRAMNKVKEPKENGGSAADQDRLIVILQTSATSDKRSLCRLSAVEALSRFKDPRAGQILIAAYNNAAYDSSPPTPGAEVSPAGGFSGVNAAISQFTPDTVTTIQCRVLEGLGRHRSPEGLNLLVQVASTPTEKRKPTEIEATAALSLELAGRASEPDRIDVRLAAIRSLGNYEKDANAVRALITVLRTEKDVAVRGRCHESLVKITGEDLPPEADAWSKWMEKPPRSK
jgi:HEAT repeat protein